MKQRPVMHSWLESLRAFLHPRVITMLFLGFSAGVPLLLIFSSLSLWLREAGVETSAVTFFSWAALGYSFKFVWAPLIDKLPLPFLTRKLGRRRSWMLLAQLSIVVAIIWMASTNPAAGQESLTWMAFAAIMLGFSSATQDIVIDAYRIESAVSELQALMSSTYIAGYRIGMLLAGAGALLLAQTLGSVEGSYSYTAWRWTYFAMAGLMLVGILTTLIIPEPDNQRQNTSVHSTRDYLGFLFLFMIAATAFVLTFFSTAALASTLKSLISDITANRHLAGFTVEIARLSVAAGIAWLTARLLIVAGLVNRAMLQETYIEPISDFFSRYGLKLAWLLLALVGLYRISDIVLGVISNVFYQDLGFSKVEIASIVKTFGLLMTLAGGFLGGLLSVRYGVMRILFLGAALSAATNLLFMLQAELGYNISLLYLVISADNLSAGLASAAFIAFLSSLTNISFTAVQYAIFSSLMTLLPKILGGYSGSMVETIGYSNFFLLTALMGIPVLLLILLANKHYTINETPPLR